MHIEFVISFIIYLLIVLCIGIISARKQHHRPSIALPDQAIPELDTPDNSSNFILGGRTTHWFLTALSAHAADMSDWLFMGLPAAVYLSGGTEIWICIGLLVGMFLSWHYIAAPLREASERLNSFTLASYFKERFGGSTVLLALTALLSCFFFAVYLSVGIKGIGYVLKSAFGIDYHVGTFLAVILVTFYTVIGGFVSVAWIDLFQGLFLLVMLILVPVVGFFHVGGWESISYVSAARNISLSLVPDFSLKTILAVLLNPFAWSLGYFGMPHILTKFMGSANTQDMHKAKYVGISWQILALSAAIMVGIVGIAYFPQAIPGRSELIFIEMAKGLFSPWIAGVVLCAILAATISTVDSQLLVLAGLIAQDFYKQFLNKKAQKTQIYNVYRTSLVVCALVGYIIAWNEDSTIMSLVKYAWSGLGSSFGPLMIASLYSNKINKYGAIAGVISGGTVSATWNLINPSITTIQIYSIVPGYIAAFVALYTVSYITRNK